MTPSCARGHANTMSAPSSLEFIAMNAPPNALRSTSVTFGTRAPANARTSCAPWRITPPCSCRLPGRNPGVSTSTTSGRPKRSQSSTKRESFCALSASSTPPRYRGWLAMTPTERPSSRANAGDDVARPARAHLEQPPAVDDRADDVAHVVDLAVVVGHDEVGRCAARAPPVAAARDRQVAEQVAHEQRGVRVGRAR